MSSAEQYREFASECLQWAATAKDEEQRRSLLDLAKTWNQAALVAELSQGEQPVLRKVL
jgi:hypothetical protein